MLRKIRHGTAAIGVGVSILLIPLAAGAAVASERTGQAVNPAPAEQTTFSGDGVRIRTGPGTGYGIVGYGYRGHSVTSYCWTGSSGDLWVQLRDNTTGVSGWSSSSLVGDYGILYLDHC